MSARRKRERSRRRHKKKDKKRDKTARGRERERMREGGKRKRSNATITIFAVSSSERAHGLGRCCGVIQSRFRPMNFLQREEGDSAGHGREESDQSRDCGAYRADGRLVGPVAAATARHTATGPQRLVSDLQH